MQAVIYNSTTGVILSFVEGSSAFIALQPQAGQAYLEVTSYVTEQTHYVDIAGTPTLTSKGTQPSPFHIWNYTTSTWELPSGSKEVAFEQLKSEYSATILGMKYSPIESFSSDSYSSTNMYYADTEWRYRYTNPGTIATSDYELDSGSIIFLGSDGVYHFVGTAWFTAPGPDSLTDHIRRRDQLLDTQLIIAVLALQNIVDDSLGTVQDMLDYVPSFIMPEHPYE
jgi:hypothetical protein